MAAAVANLCGFAGGFSVPAAQAADVRVIAAALPLGCVTAGRLGAPCPLTVTMTAPQQRRRWRAMPASGGCGARRDVCRRTRRPSSAPVRRSRCHAASPSRSRPARTALPRLPARSARQLVPRAPPRTARPWPRRPALLANLPPAEAAFFVESSWSDSQDAPLATETTAPMTPPMARSGNMKRLP